MHEQGKSPALLLALSKKVFKGQNGGSSVSLLTKGARTAHLWLTDRPAIPGFFVKFLESCFLGPCKDSLDNHCQAGRMNLHNGQTLSRMLERAGCNAPSPSKVLVCELLGQYSFVLYICRIPWSVWSVFVSSRLLAKYCAQCVEEKGLTVRVFGGIKV